MPASGGISSDVISLVRCALISRLFVIALLAVTHTLFVPFDQSLRADLTECKSVTERALLQAAAPFVHWDGIHFLSIAESGYTHDKLTAFMPLWPLILRFAAQIPPISLVPICSTVKLAIVAVISANTCFIISVVVFYYLSQRLLPLRIAYIAAVLYVFSPAAVFVSVGYTEALYSLITLTALTLYEYQYQTLAALIFAFSVLTRTNGLLYCAFYLLRALMTIRHALQTPRSYKSAFVYISAIIGPTILHIIIIITPYICFSSYIISHFCSRDDNNQTTKPTYCHDKLPTIYAYVQSEYWNVGLLSYFTVKQIPNFLLAAPMIISVSFALTLYGRNRWQTYMKSDHWSENNAMDAYVCHLAISLVVCVCLVHIQVTTRILAMLPALYWTIALMADQNSNDRGMSSSSHLISLVWSYWWTIYATVGSILFAMFLPWT